MQPRWNLFILLSRIIEILATRRYRGRTRVLRVYQEQHIIILYWFVSKFLTFYQNAIKKIVYDRTATSKSSHCQLYVYFILYYGVAMLRGIKYNGRTHTTKYYNNIVSYVRNLPQTYLQITEINVGTLFIIFRFLSCIEKKKKTRARVNFSYIIRNYPCRAINNFLRAWVYYHFYSFVFKQSNKTIKTDYISFISTRMNFIIISSSCLHSRNSEK